MSVPAAFCVMSLCAQAQCDILRDFPSGHNRARARTHYRDETRTYGMVPGDLVVNIQARGAVQLGDEFALDGRARDGTDGVVLYVRFDHICREGGVQVRDTLRDE